MTRVARAVDRYLYAPSSGERIAAVRILLAGYLLAYFASMLPHVPLLFSRDGVYAPYLVPDYAPAPGIAWVAFVAMLGATLALLCGYRTAVAAPLLLCLFLYHYFLQLAVKHASFDRLIAIDLLVLCFADSGRRFGLDARRPGPQPTRWAERLIGFQLLVLYAGAGLWKAFHPDWRSGVLLRSTLQGMFATPLAFSIVQLEWGPAFWAGLSIAVIGLELALAPLLLVKKTRPLGLALGTSFHLMNCFLLVIPEFLVCLASYPVFMRRSTIQRAAAVVRALGPREVSAR